ncbi:MAG: GIY-YIG nuclease family protein [Thermodesulfobacteriota bacterium]
MMSMIQEKSWYVYIVRCSDGTLYTGITRDPERRMAEHNAARGGARYTRARQPVELIYVEAGPSRSVVCRREQQIKKLPRAAKLLLALTPEKNEISCWQSPQPSL